jgi:hypothetical protein
MPQNRVAGSASSRSLKALRAQSMAQQSGHRAEHSAIEGI